MKFKSKKIVYVLIMVLSSMLHAEWDTITLKEHVERSSLIVVATFHKELERKDTDIGLEQLVEFEMVEAIKGEANGILQVRGQAFEMCVAQMFFEKTSKGNYLLFLKQEDNATTYNLVHGECSGLFIDKESVGWISDRSKIDAGARVKTALTKVKHEINQIINKGQK